jgi:5S rRNA maturation endonuclease (ribonuclease M5)
MPEVRPLYNLPRVIASNSIIIAEGEKSADALIKTGYSATTAMGGANTPLDKTDFTPLSGKDITLWPDNDAVGKRYAEKLYHHLKEKAKSIKIIDIPKDKPSKWDAADCDNIKEFLSSCLYYEPDNKTKLNSINPLAWKGEPPAREWILKDWIPRGYVSALYGDGGVGKSLLAQQILTAISVGADFITPKYQPSSTVAIFCEDDEDELWRRQAAINRAFNIDMSALKNMRLLSRLGFSNSLMRFEGE